MNRSAFVRELLIHNLIMRRRINRLCYIEVIPCSFGDYDGSAISVSINDNLRRHLASYPLVTRPNRAESSRDAEQSEKTPLPIARHHTNT